MAGAGASGRGPGEWQLGSAALAQDAAVKAAPHALMLTGAVSERLLVSGGRHGEALTLLASTFVVQGTLGRLQPSPLRGPAPPVAHCRVGNFVGTSTTHA